MKSLWSFFVAAVLAAVVFPRTGDAAVVAASRPAKWHSDKVKARLSSVVLDETDEGDRRLYAGGSDGRLYAFDGEDGALLYPTPAPRFGGGQCSAPLIGPDGTLYLAFTDGTLVAVTNAATSTPGLLWRYRTRAAFVGSPVIDADGMVYIGSKDNQLHAVPSDQGGNLRATNAWVFNAKGDVTSTPLVTLLGDVVFLSGGTVFTVTSDGDQAGVFHAGSSVQSIPVAAEDGTIYFGANNGFFYKIEGGAGTGTNAATGTNGVIFRLKAGADVKSSAAIGAAGRVYFGTDAGQVLCADDDGVVWRFPSSGRTKGAVRSDLAIGADGTIFAGTEGHTLYAITAAGQEKWHFDQFKGAMRSSPVIDSEGTVYFSAGHYIYAVEDEVSADEAPWPQFRGDAQHTATSTHTEIFVRQGLSDITNRVGSNVTFAVVASSSAPLFYQWSRAGAVLPGTTNATLFLSNLQATDAGRYSVVISNAFETPQILSALLTIEGARPVIVTNLTDHFVSAGSILHLGIVAVGTPPLFFQWRTNGVAVTDATNSTLDFTSDVPTTEPVAFDVTITNASGATNSRTALVTVVELNLARPAVSIGAGNLFSSAIVSNQLFTWGSDATGQLGDGAFTNRVVPTRTSTNLDWLSVSAGGRGNSVSSATAHALALRTDGSLYAWGANARGQLGIGTTNDSRVPVQVGTSANWMQVEAGANHSVGLRADGTIWTWGDNQFGQLGLGHTNNVLGPVQMGLDSAWVEVRAGGSFTLARRYDGTLWAWGRNDSGQLGNGTNIDVRTPVQIATNLTWASISAGVSHSLSLGSNGTMWAWGRQFGLTNRNINATSNAFFTPFRVGTNSDWKVIDAGFDHSLAINAAGNLFAFGANNVGQLGNDQTGLSSGQTNLANRTLPDQIGRDRTWQSIQAGVKHSVARAVDGSIWAWGLNNFGQVGDGTTTNHPTPVSLTFTNFANVNTNGTNVGPPVFIRQPASTNVAPNKIVTFSAAVSGAPLTGMMWYFNTNSPIAIATNLSYTFFAVEALAGSYHIVVTNSSGVATSSFAFLTFTTNSGSQGPAPVGMLPAQMAETISLLQPMLLPAIPGANGITVPVLNGASGQSYVLEFKNSLADSNWTAIATNQGPITNFVDPSAPGASRYYRLRAQ